MKKILATLSLAALMAGCSDGGSGISDKTHAEASDPKNEAINPTSNIPARAQKTPIISPKVELLTITRESLLSQLSNTFPNQLCSKINHAKIPMSSTNCSTTAQEALSDCINDEKDNLPEVITIHKTTEAPDIIATLKPILTCTKTKMGISSDAKVAIKLNFEFNESPSTN